MAFTQRRTSLRQEVRKGSAGSVRLWCTVDGESVAAYASGHTYSVLSDLAETIQAATSVSPTTIDGESYFDLAIPAISTLREGCRVVVEWLDSGQTARVSQLFFDVVTTPWGDTPRPTVTDLQAVRPDLLPELDRLGVFLGYASGDEAQAEAASNVTYQARIELDLLLRARASADKQIRPALILDTDRLFPLEVALALAVLYESIASRPGEEDAGDGDADGLAQYYRRRANAMLAGLRVVYDLDQDQAADGEPQGPLVSIVRTTRVQ